MNSFKELREFKYKVSVMVLSVYGGSNSTQYTPDSEFRLDCLDKDDVTNPQDTSKQDLVESMIERHRYDVERRQLY